MSSSAYAQSVYLQDSTIIGTNSTLTATRVPIVTSSGIVYQDLTISLAVGSNGNLKVSKTTAILSPTPDVGNFVAGAYQGSGGAADNQITVSGPGVTSGGATEWSVALTPGASNDSGSHLTSGTFYVGPVASNPLYNRIVDAKITNTTAYSFGLSGGGNNGFASGFLLGFAQTGNTLTVVNFTNGSGDSSVPLMQYTYTLAN